jgi:hypothetical protein
MPTVLSKDISATVTSSQERHVYHPARRSCALKQSKADNQKFKAALDNELDPYGWSYTSNARVFPEYKGGVTVTWKITIRRRTHASQKTSTNKKSGAQYNSQIVAEHLVYAGSTYSHSFKPRNPPHFLDGKAAPPEADVILEAIGIPRKKRNDELIKDLEAAGFNPKGKVEVLKARCVEARIAIMTADNKKISGYVDKPKGALEIA